MALPTFEELYEQIRTLPEGVTGEILEPGVLRTMSRPAALHRWTARMLGRSLAPYDKCLGGTGWWIEVEAEVLLPGGYLAVPDLSGWRVDRMPEIPEENPIPIVPDWCCEILSPTTARDDRSLKLPLYARSGVARIWIVDPQLKLVEVFETSGGRPLLVESARDEEPRVLPPFEGELAIGTWWDQAFKAP